MESWLGPSCHQPTFSRHRSPRTGECHPYVAISSNTSRACARSVARQRAGHSRQLQLLYAAAALFTQSPKSPSVTTSRTKNFSRRSASTGQPPAARSPNREKGASRERHARPLRPPERLTRSKGGVRGGVEAEAEAEAEAASLRREDGGVGGAGARWCLNSSTVARLTGSYEWNTKKIRGVFVTNT